MARFRLETPIAAPPELVFDLARDIDFHQRSMSRANERAVGGRASGRIELGETVTWRASHFGISWTLTSRVVEMSRPDRFVDEQVDGPFAAFRHLHLFQAAGEGTLMIDEWRHRPPFGFVGRLVDGLVLGPYMKRLLRRRNAVLALEAKARASSI